MSKIYYKVVTDKLQSCWVIDDNLSVQYKEGEFVSAKIPQLPLAAFETLKQAQTFVYNLPYRDKNYYIYSCNIKNKYREAWLPGKSKSVYWPSIQRLLQRIKKHQKYLDRVIINPVHGTVSCKQIKLINRVCTISRSY